MGVPQFPQFRIRMTALFLGSGWSMGNPEVIPRTACKVSLSANSPSPESQGRASYRPVFWQLGVSTERRPLRITIRHFREARYTA
jgi:hypothetical protein